jgi:predicted O-methyltransferase YrrM
MRTFSTYRRPATLGLVSGILAAVAVALASILPIASMAAVVPVGLIVGAVVATSVLLRNRVVKESGRIDARMDAGIGRVLAAQAALERQVAEVAAIAKMSAIDVPYPLPLGGGWPLAWDGAEVLAREVGSSRPERVVELGSGASSLVIGLQLRHAGRGHLYTLEHEPHYAAVTRRHVQALGLEPWVTVFDAPLVDWPLGEEHFRWYRLPDEVTALGQIDFLVIDGPPQSLDPEGTPRYPALAVLGERLGPGSTVFVDDANRAGEQRMLARWTTEDPTWSSEIVPTLRGTALLRRPG